jgi:hypothetical protein
VGAPWHTLFRTMRMRQVAAIMAATLLAHPGTVLAGGVEPGVSSSTVRGHVGCNNYDDSGPCRNVDVDSPERARTFAMADEVTGDGDLIRYSLEYAESYGPGDELAAVTVRGRFQSSNATGGNALLSGTYDGTVEDVEGIEVTGSMSATLSGSDFIVSVIDFSVSIDCEVDEYEIEAEAVAGASESYSNSKSAIVNGRVEGSDYCTFDVAAFVQSATNRPAPGQHGSTDLQFEVTFTVLRGQSEGCDGLTGVVRDGDAASGHENSLRGIRVDLREAAGSVLRSTSTDDDGRYCVESGEGVPPGDYLLRATLIDATRPTPLFETRYRGAAEAAFTEVTVTADDFGVDRQTNVEFAPVEGRDWLADVANIHWQTERFVRWLTVDAGLTPEVIQPFIVDAFSTNVTSYRASTRTASISSDGSPGDNSRYSNRNGPRDEGPENAEWHEVGHHIGNSLGIAPSSTAPACANRINHGGWLNATTCDSLSEGFAAWIATVASLDIDADRGPDYADAVYSDFGSLESNGWRPWGRETDATGRDLYREDFAVAELLWDLTDDTPEEEGAINLTDPAEPVPDVPWVFTGKDRVALGGVNLLGLLGQIRPTTVDELYRGLLEHPSVPSDIKTADVNLLGDDPAEMSPLMEVFLLHGFHPIFQEANPRYTVGEPVGRTDHESGGSGLVPRPHIERIQGSNVLLRNSTTSEVAFEIAVDAGPGSWRRTVVVGATAEELAYLEVPPYWPGILPDGAGLPACREEGQTLVTITISAPGARARTLDSCEYLHAVAGAAGDAAVIYELTDGLLPTGGDGAPAAETSTPTMLLAGALAVAVVAVVLVGLKRRRGHATRNGPSEE